MGSAALTPNNRLLSTRAIANAPQAGAALPRREEDLEPRTLMQASASHIANHSDNGDPGILGLVRIAEYEALADRILIGPVRFGERLIDDGGQRGFLPVMSVEESSV